MPPEAENVCNNVARNFRFDPKRKCWTIPRFLAAYLLQFVNILEVECCVEQSEERVYKLELKIHWILSLNDNTLNTHYGYFENEVSFVVRLNFVVF